MNQVRTLNPNPLYCCLVCAILPGPFFRGVGGLGEARGLFLSEALSARASEAESAGGLSCFIQGLQGLLHSIV